MVLSIQTKNPLGATLPSIKKSMYNTISQIIHIDTDSKGQIFETMVGK
jgi:hypothetical protein